MADPEQQRTDATDAKDSADTKDSKDTKARAKAKDTEAKADKRHDAKRHGELTPPRNQETTTLDAEADAKKSPEELSTAPRAKAGEPPHPTEGTVERPVSDHPAVDMAPIPKEQHSARRATPQQEHGSPTEDWTPGGRIDRRMAREAGYEIRFEENGPPSNRRMRHVVYRNGAQVPGQIGFDFEEEALKFIVYTETVQRGGPDDAPLEPYEGVGGFQEPAPMTLDTINPAPLVPGSLEEQQRSVLLTPAEPSEKDLAYTTSTAADQNKLKDEQTGGGNAPQPERHAPVADAVPFTVPEGADPEGSQSA